MRANDTDYNFKEVIFVPETIVNELTARNQDISVVSNFRKLVNLLDKNDIVKIAQLNGAIDELCRKEKIDYKVSSFLPIKNNRQAAVLNPDFWSGEYELESNFIAELLDNHAVISEPNSFVKDFFLIGDDSVKNLNINMDDLSNPSDNKSYHIYDRDGKFVYVSIKPKTFALMFNVFGSGPNDHTKDQMLCLLREILSVFYRYHSPQIVAKSKWFRHYLSLLQ